MTRTGVMCGVVILCFVVTVPLSGEAKRKKDYPYYEDPVHGWVFGLTGTQFHFDDAKRFVETMRLPGVSAAIALFGGEAGLKGVPRGLLYHQVYKERGQYVTCYINPNGHTLTLTQRIQVTLSVNDTEVVSRACFLFDDVRQQDWLWDSRRDGPLTITKSAVEKVEHSPLGWVMVVSLFDPVIRDISDIRKVTVTGIK